MSDLKTQLSTYFDAVVERVDGDNVPDASAVDLQPHRLPVRSGLVYAVGAAAVVMLLGAISLWAFPRDSAPTDNPPADTVDATDPPPGVSTLPPVALGAKHVWPDTPSSLSSVELAELFAREALGWDSAGATEFSDAVPGGPAWLHITQPGVEELVDVLTVPSGDGGRVIVEVGTPWARGVDLRPLDGGGVSIVLLRIVEADAAEVLLQLTDGRQLADSTSMDLTTTAAVRVEFPDVDLDSIGSILVRYVSEDGTVIAAAGASQEASTSVTRDDVPDSCPITVAGTQGFVPATAAPEPPPSTYDVAWYGTPELWTMVDPDGEVWADLPIGEDGTLTERTFWWSENYTPQDPGEITVTARQLDGPGSTFEASQQAGSGFNPFMLQPTHDSVTVVGLALPDAGCWELSATYKESTLSYTIWVSDT